MEMKIEKLRKCAECVNDPRRLWGNLRHKLEDVIVIGLITLICGGVDFVDMEELGKDKEGWLRGFLELPNGIPDSDTFRRIFENLNPAELAKCLDDWVSGEREAVKTVGIDGKTIRGSANACHRAYHVVSAWAGEQGITLGQVAVDEKNNEITAIPELLDMIDIKGAVVTIDAMGCQTAIASKIRERGADYVLALKANHKNLYNRVLKRFNNIDETMLFDEYTETENGHGRTERRTISVISACGLDAAGEWADLRSIIRCRYIAIENGKECVVERFYLSSLEPNARRVCGLVRGHWSIENQLHWVLDVVFGEDAARAQKGNAPLNMNVLRKTALRLLLRVDAGKRVGLKKKMFRAALKQDFLEMVLFGE